MAFFYYEPLPLATRPRGHADFVAPLHSGVVAPGGEGGECNTMHTTVPPAYPRSLPRPRDDDHLVICSTRTLPPHCPHQLPYQPPRPCLRRAGQNLSAPYVRLHAPACPSGWPRASWMGLPYSRAFLRNCATPSSPSGRTNARQASSYPWPTAVSPPSPLSPPTAARVLCLSFTKHRKPVHTSAVCDY